MSNQKVPSQLVRVQPNEAGAGFLDLGDQWLYAKQPREEVEEVIALNVRVVSSVRDVRIVAPVKARIVFVFG